MDDFIESGATPLGEEGTSEFHELTQLMWGSDAIAQLLSRFGISYLCLNPGSSFRGLHDSIVNYLGNRRPEMLLCLHEEHAVSIAHGYAKVTGRPLAVALHSNVGLMHASMAVYNAWCDRVPMLIIGAHGPADAAKRRPWIDWIHTSQDTAALIRPYVKWDNQPLSLAASLEALLRGYQITLTTPTAPVYICLDSSVQESKIVDFSDLPDPRRYCPPRRIHPGSNDIERAVAILAGASKPFILMGRVSRIQKEWDERVLLAERLGATVLTDLKVGASFPTDHPQHPFAPSFFLSDRAAKALREADVVLALDWLDLGGTLKCAWPNSNPTAKIISVSLDQTVHRAWSFDHQSLAPIDLPIAADVGLAVTELLDRTGGQLRDCYTRPAEDVDADCGEKMGDGISLKNLASALAAAVGTAEVTLIRLPLGWNGNYWPFRGPMDYLGYDGGGGIASGPGMAVGAALALKGTRRLPVAILGDGDFLMGNTALWSAAHMNIPVLIVIANNQSFYNDEVHQERVALDRGRPVENKGVGQRMDAPPIDLASIARAQGFRAWGAIQSTAELDMILAEAVSVVAGGNAAFVEVRVTPGYAPSMSKGMTKSNLGVGTEK
ncbi:MAG: thiamine pyrophosphate-binding protein [Alphaproteobacteria bacterium]|nr:thiamine pyrophosphate-binding protein [Alphaproteobacteria bacterium]